MELEQEPVPIRHMVKNAQCTRAASVFERRHSYIFGFFFYGVQLASTVDKQRIVAARALASRGTDEDVARLAEVEKRRSPAFDKLAQFGTYQAETISIRFVDNFNCYLSDLLQEAFRRQPNLLKSSEQIQIDELLEFRRFSDLIKFLVERKLGTLSYSGLDAMRTYLNKALGLELCATDEAFRKLKLAIELRNVFTHNRGRIDRTFQKRVGSQPWIDVAVGKIYQPDLDTIIMLANNLHEVVVELDKNATQKSGLVKRRYTTWRKQIDSPVGENLVSYDE